ncbi:MAG: hypothetical protein B6I20_06795 [Bacteroidetes bacterium 4572_117]|nr:MAG: hypothetical protein B6I20_06795 [Bacteroidetes bacterium 4572_117]
MKAKPTYQELEKELEAFRITNNLIEKSPIIWFIWRNEETWPVEFVSENVKSILGYTKDDFLSGKANYSEIIHPADLQRVENEVSEKSRTNLNSFTHKPYRLISKTGEIKWIKNITIIRKDKDNGITHFEGVIIDITEQKETEESLIQSELRWKFAIEGNSDGLWDWDLLSNDMFFSEQWKNMFGFTGDEIKGSLEEWDKRVHPDDKEKVSEDINKHLNGETDSYQNEHRVLCKDNSYKWVLDRGKIISYTSDKKPARMIGTHTDITKQNVVTVISITGKLLYTSSAVTEFAGYIPKEEIGNNISKYFANKKDLERAFNLIEEVKRTQKGGYFEFLYKPKNKAPFSVEQTYMPLIENNKVYAIQLVLRDISERKKHEQALKQRDTYITALNQATSLLLQNNSIPYQKFTEIIGKAANASRTYIFKNNVSRKDELLTSQISEYCAIGIKPEIDNPVLQALSFSNWIPRWVNLLAKNKIVKGKIADFPRKERKLLEPQDIKAILIIPIIIDRQFWGFIGFDNCINEQEWTLTEQKYLETAAKNLEQEIKRNKTQKLLQAENQRFQTTMDAMDAIVYVADIETYELLYLNKLGKELTGDKIGEKCYTALQKRQTKPCDFCTNHLLVDKNGNAKKPYIWEFQNTKTKHWYQCRDQAIKWIDGRLVRIEIATDVSDKKHAETALISEKVFSEKIIETSSALIVGLDHKHIIRIFNKGAEKTTGYKKAEVIGKDWFKIFFPEKMLNEMNSIWENSWKTLSHSYENPILTKSGNEKIVSWQTTGLYDGKDISKHIMISIGEDITDRKQVEQALIESKEKYHTVANYAYDMEYWVSPQGKFIYVSPSCERITGYNVNEFLQNPSLLLSIVHPDDKGIMKKHRRGASKTDNAEPIEFRIITKSGEIRWIGHVCQNVYNSNEVYIGIRGSNRDITSHKNSEQVLKEKRKLNELLLDSMPYPIMLINKKRIVLAANKLALDSGVVVGDYCWKEFGKSLCLSEKNKLRALNNPDDPLIKCTFCLADEIGQTNKPANNPAVDAFGKIWDTYWIPLNDNEYLHYAIDITDRKKDELLLKKQLNYISFTNKLSTGFINIESIEIDKMVTELIKTTAQFTGVERAYVFLLSADKKRLEMTHEWCKENIASRNGVFDRLNVTDYKDFVDTLKRNEIVQLHTADLKLLPEHKANMAILDQLQIKSFIVLPLLTGSKLIGFIGFDATDGQIGWTTEMMDSYNLCKAIITNTIERNTADTALSLSKLELQKLNNELVDMVKIEVDKSREKDHMMMVQSRQAAMGEMIGSIAHQWRQPLNDIGLYVQNLQNKFTKDRLTKENVDNLVEKTMTKLEYMSHTIEDFRNFFRGDKEKKIFSLEENINNALLLTKSSFDNNFIEVISKLQKDVFLSGYPNEFSQAVLNILNNAKDVLIDREIENPYVGIDLLEYNDKITLLISDNGGGVDEDVIDKIFEPYFTTKSEQTGTGLGLHISKTIIERNMDGKLSVRNTKIGTEFKIEFKQ